MWKVCHNFIFQFKKTTNNFQPLESRGRKVLSKIVFMKIKLSLNFKVNTSSTDVFERQNR